MIQKFLNTQTKTVGAASFILGAFYIVSALLGLLRERLLAGRLGAGNELDAYYAAFTIPDFVALILVLGAISAAIIPIFTGYLAKSEDEAWEYASALLNVFLTFLIVVCGVLIMFAPFFVRFIAPGFSPEKQATTVMLMRIMFLSPIILGISNIVSGILQVFHRFLVTALAPLMYNLGIILGIIFFVPRLGLVGLAFGVVLGGVLHLIIQIPALFYSGFKIQNVKFKIQIFSHAGVRKTLLLMIPRSLGLGAGQINTIATTAIASTLVIGSVAVFNLANNLANMVISVLAVSLSTAIFPSLSRAYLQETKTDFERKFSAAFLQLLFLTVPAGVLLFILRAQVVRVLLGTGRIDWTATRLIAACLGIFAVGLCFQGLVFLLSKTFYATHNTKIPAIVSAVTVACNIGLSLSLVWLLNLHGVFYSFMQAWLRLQGIGNISVVGLALAFTVTGIAESMLLLWLLYKHYKVFRARVLAISLSKIIIAAAAAAAAALVVRQGLVVSNLVQLQTFIEVFIQLSLSGVTGTVVYLAVSFMLKSPELVALKQLILNKK